MNTPLLPTCLTLLFAACGAAPPPATAESPASVAATPAQAAPAPAPTTPLPSPCQLIDESRAQAVMDNAVALMVDDPEACLWTSSGGVGQIAMLHVSVSEHDDEAMAQAVFNGIAGMAGDLGQQVNTPLDERTKKRQQELEALGDEAWLSGTSFGGSVGRHQIGAEMLVVRKGRRVLTLNVTGTSALEGLAERLQVAAGAALEQL